MKPIRSRVDKFYSTKMVFLAVTALFLSGCASIFARDSRPVPGGEILISKGNVAFSRLDYQKAWESYRKAQALGVRDAILFYRIGVLEDMLNKPGKGSKENLRAEAVSLLESAYKRGAERPLIYFYLAQIRQSSRKLNAEKTRLYAEAVRKFETKKFGPLNSEDYEKLARMYLFMGRADEAENIFLKSQELDQDNALSKYYLGKLYRQTGRFSAAVKQFEDFLKLAPKDVEGYILLGESQYEAGDYDRAEKAFQMANSLDSVNTAARAGLQLTKRTLARRGQLRAETRDFVWDVGLRSRVKPLTLGEDNLEFNNDSLGGSFFGPDGRVSFVSGGGSKFRIYTLSADGLNINMRATSSSGFSGALGVPNLYLVALGVGRNREIGAYNDLRGTFKSIYQGYCEEPAYSAKTKKAVCVTPRGVLLIDSVTDNVTTLHRESGAHHPRFTRDGKKVVVVVGDELVLLNLVGQVLQRHRMSGGKEAANYPDISPDGRWIISGGKGLYLTSLRDRISILLRHPSLQDARKASFSADGSSIVFERNGRLYHLDLPKPIGSFFAFQQANMMIQAKRYGAAVRLLNERKAKDGNLPGYFLLLGKAYLGLEFREKAEISARRAALLDLKNWRPNLLLGRIMAANQNWGKAALYLNRAVELGPDRYEGYLERGKILSLQGKTNSAILDYQKAIDRMGAKPVSKGEAIVIGLFDLYVSSKKISEALLLLLDHADRLSAETMEMVQTDSRYLTIRNDPRFAEVVGPAREVAESGMQMQALKMPALPEAVPDTSPARKNQLFQPREKNTGPEIERSRPVARKEIKSSAMSLEKMSKAPVMDRGMETAKKEMKAPAKSLKMEVSEKKIKVPVKISKEKMKTRWVLSGVRFGFDQSTIKPKFYSVLNRAVAVLKKNPGLHVEIQGHTDSRGRASYNQRLSEKRAVAVMKYFVLKGVHRKRLSAKGFGESSPIVSNSTASGRTKNRRVELKAKETEVFASK